MSETDDTDVLLLIPPNFFLVQSSGSEDSLLESSRTVVHKPLSCTAQVIKKLVNQVQTLDSRLESLEFSTDLSSFGSRSLQKALDTTDSFDSRSLDRKCFTFPRRRRRKTVRKESKRELSLTSLDSLSAYRKSIPPLRLDQPTSPYPKPIESINETRSMDGDISSIVSSPSKKTDKRLLNEIDEFLTKVESYESPNSKYKDREGALSPENIIKTTGDYLSQKLDSHIEDQITLPSGRIVDSSILDKYIYLVRNNATSQLEKSLPSTSGNRNLYETSINHTMESTIKHDIPKALESKSPSMRKLNFTDKDVQPTSTPKRNTKNYLDTFRPTSNKIYDRATKVLEQYKAQNRCNSEHSVSDSYLRNHLQKEEFKMPQMRPYGGQNQEGIQMQDKLLDSIDTDLLSLSELWGERAEQERADRVDSVKLEEERLKREQLQKKVLEQQEKLAVAIRVDRSKDTAITKLKEAWLRLTGSLDKAEERHRNALEKMLREVDNFRAVADDTQKEKCKQLIGEKRELEDSMVRALETKQEIIAGREREIEVLKENYETVMRLNKQSTDCVKNLEDALEKSAADDTTLLVQERNVLKEKVNEERGRCNMLERQLCDKQNLASELLKKCDTLDAETKTLCKHMELQKCELKSHYQKQLEDAVLSKLQEFQQQLDVASREMERQLTSKENAIREEIKLYRLQLAQTSEKIGLLESKLESYRRRRGQIATQLHGVMESQWRQALLILTHGNGNNVSSLDITRQDSESYRRRRGQIATQLHGVMESQWRQALLILTHGNGNNVSSLDITRQDSGERRIHYKLESYRRRRGQIATQLHGVMESHGDSLPPPLVRELSEEPTSDRPDKDRRDKNKRSLNSSKPPWKA
ncbi:Centrobin [Operophtera brumata]|uniref:Centrobin n=1 Tax=Operophtera brumata TaxID=104452 RepID=A0A0L7KUE8_OPEBR|nr:Centrobin [Operophtera brumata]